MKATSFAQRNSDPTEIRFGERIAVELPVSLAANGVTGDGLLRDVSISGGLIETSLDLPVFTNLTVRLPASGESAPRLELAACVVRHSSEGVGVEWRDMACPMLLALLREAGCEATQVAPCDRAFR
jgi:hypothetical protein